MEKKRKIKRRWLILIGIIAALIIFRLFLPSIVLHYVNKTLSEIPDYRGHVNDIDIHLYRGAYQIKGIELNKITGKVPEPFFSSNLIDLSVEWAALMDGEIAGEMVFTNPKINFVSGPTKEQSQTDVDSSWVDVVKELFPFKINRLEIVNGEVHYKDFHSSPKVDIFMNNINAVALNLTNTADSTSQLPSSVQATGNTFGKGAFTFNMKLNPLEEPTPFDLNAELKNVNLVELNDFLKAYGKFDVSGGTFGLYTELAAKNGQFEGYVKPVIKDLEVVEWGKEKDDSFLQKVWETVIATGSEILENRGEQKEQIASKVPLSGKLENPQINIVATVWALLRNAFIQALMPSLDNSVSIGTVGGEGSGGVLGGDSNSKEDDKKDGGLFNRNKDEKKKD